MNKTIIWLFATGIYLVISGVVMMNRWYHSFGDVGMLIFFAIHIIAIGVCIALMSAVIRQLIHMHRLEHGWTYDTKTKIWSK